MNEPNKSGMSSSMKRAPQNDNCLLLFPQHKNSRVLRWSHMMIWNIKSAHPGSSPAGQIQVQKWTPETRGCWPAFCERFYPFLFFNFINWHQFCLVRTTSMSESEPRRLATGVSWRRVFLPRAQKNPHHRSQKWNNGMFTFSSCPWIWIVKTVSPAKKNYTLEILSQLSLSQRLMI